VRRSEETRGFIKMNMIHIGKDVAQWTDRMEGDHSAGLCSLINQNNVWVLVSFRNPSFSCGV